MADKGFDLKVLIPTDDGLVISEKGIAEANFYLMYNLSNRSYQLSGKVKTLDFFKTKMVKDKLNHLLVSENIDAIVEMERSLVLDCVFIKTPKLEINEILNNLIDEIDKKSELNV